MSLKRQKMYRAIARRANDEIFDGNLDFITLCMDIEAADCNIPMDLTRLLEADRFNFAHDVCGIVDHLNRTTFALMHCFVPRFAHSRRPSRVPKRPSWVEMP